VSRPTESRAFTPRTRPVVPPIHHSVTYYLDDKAYADVQAGGLDEHWYGRFRNPTADVTASAVARLEGGATALMTSSGMGAIATTLLTLVRAGDRVVAARQVYGDTRDLLVRDLPGWGIDVVQVDAADLDAWREAVAGGPTTVVYAETLANPQLELTDVAGVAAIAHQAGARFVVDNTFATPWLVKPLSLGADVVVHSATKFLNGHSDVIAGAVVGDVDLVREVQRRVVTLGTCLDAHAAYQVWRGLQTFEVRMARQCATAARIAAELAGHPDVVSVRYPAIGGAMVAFTVAGGDARAGAVIRRLQVASEATSLGGVETLVSTPFNSSHFSLTPEERRAARIDDGMIRLSVGLEDPADLIADLTGALEATR
jgi:cystathionine beta-lyase/cystathionine gamma-synthase